MASSKKQKTQPLDVDVAEVESLLEKAGSSALQPAEVEKLRQVVETLQFITGELDKKRVSVKRLQQMLFGSSSEHKRSPRLRELLKNATAQQQPSDSENTGSEVTGEPQAPPKAPAGKPKPKGHGRRSSAEYTGGERKHVEHPSIKPKDPCPKCPTGRLYKQKDPKVLVRLVGTAPIQAKVWSYDWFRCNLCGFIVDTPLPEEAGPKEKYDESVTSTIGVLRYGYGMPLNRLAQLQESHAIPLPASTQWDLIDKSVPVLMPVFTEFIRRAARGEVIHNDDTTARVLEVMAERKARAPDQQDKRSGIFTTGLVSEVGEHKIALYLTGKKHAGENLTDVLATCEEPRRPLVQMSDGLDRNEPSELPEGLAVIQANCMAHGRRKYVEIAESFPEQCLHVIGQLEIVYRNDARTRREKMSANDRLTYHKAHSAPVMAELKAWLETQLDDKLVEPNSAFGQATKYMLKRWDRLTRFLTVAGAPIDNNICERALKKSIRHRKNSMFYKTLHGARVGDIYMSLIHTCELNGVNVFEYLKALLGKGERVAEELDAWMPWTYAADSDPSAVQA